MHSTCGGMDRRKLLKSPIGHSQGEGADVSQKDTERPFTGLKTETCVRSAFACKHLETQRQVLGLGCSKAVYCQGFIGFELRV